MFGVFECHLLKVIGQALHWCVAVPLLIAHAAVDVWCAGLEQVLVDDKLDLVAAQLLLCVGKVSLKGNIFPLDNLHCMTAS